MCLVPGYDSQGHMPCGRNQRVIKVRSSLSTLGGAWDKPGRKHARGASTPGARARQGASMPESVLAPA